MVRNTWLLTGPPMTTRFSSSAESGNERDVYTFLTWHDRLEERKYDSSVAAANSAGWSMAMLRAPSEGVDTSVTTMFAVAPRGRTQTFDAGRRENQARIAPRVSHPVMTPINAAK